MIDKTFFQFFVAGERGHPEYPAQTIDNILNGSALIALSRNNLCATPRWSSSGICSVP